MEAHVHPLPCSLHAHCAHDKIGASVAATGVPSTQLAAQVSEPPGPDQFDTNALLESVDNPEVPLPGQINGETQ